MLWVNELPLWMTRYQSQLYFYFACPESSFTDLQSAGETPGSKGAEKRTPHYLPGGKDLTPDNQVPCTRDCGKPEAQNYTLWVLPSSPCWLPTRVQAWGHSHTQGLSTCRLTRVSFFKGQPFLVQGLEIESWWQEGNTQRQVRRKKKRRRRRIRSEGREQWALTEKTGRPGRCLGANADPSGNLRAPVTRVYTASRPHGSCDTVPSLSQMN